MHSLHVACGCFHSIRALLNTGDGDCSPRSLKYWHFGSLQKKFADSSAKESEEELAKGLTMGGKRSERREKGGYRYMVMIIY